MELKNALRQLILSKGSQVLDNINLPNMLADFKAYEDIPACRFLIKICLSEGMMSTIINIYNSGEESVNQLNLLRKDLENQYGFREDVVNYFIDSLSDAFGWHYTPSKDIVSENQNKRDTKISSRKSQNSGKHLTFKGIGIYGNPEDVILQLESQGYTLIQPYSYNDHTAVLLGSFAGVQNCTILVSCTPSTDVVYSIGVIFPENYTDWFSLKNQYQYYKDNLSKKYGEIQPFEYFQDPYYEGDGYELTAIMSRQGHFMSSAETPKGKISVMITSDCKICLFYQDKSGTELNEKEMNSISLEDI